jgi:DNA-binding response OmpR family regulator
MHKRILVIEDDPDIATLLRLVAHDAGYDVTEAGTLAAARAHLATGVLLNLVVLDFFVPDGDPLGFCEEVQAALPALPVLMLSGDVSDPTRESARAVGCVEFVGKPFDPDTLTDVIRIALGDMPDRRRRPRTRETAPRRAS